MSRRLDADEEALWALVAATVKPLHAKPLHAIPLHPGPIAAPLPSPPSSPIPIASANAIPQKIARPDREGVGPRRSALPPPAPKAVLPRHHSESLDGSWDRRLGGGRIVPDVTIDLHGLSREAARHLLYRRVVDAEARGQRVILVITGKGHRAGPAPADLVPGLRTGPTPRGGIKADLPRWLGEEGLSGRIAAVRRAHPRHGGAGAAYLILKRKRG